MYVQPQVPLKNQGLERNAVEHAGDIADALQQRLSVCLRRDRRWVEGLVSWKSPAKMGIQPAKIKGFPPKKNSNKWIDL